VLEVLYHHAKFGGARISPAAGVAKNVEFFVTDSIARSATRRYLSYSEADFEFFFAPQGRHIPQMGVKFGMEERTPIPSSMPNFTPIHGTS